MILARHAQSHFNLHFGATRRDPGIVDPGLTEDGVSQANSLGESLAGHDIHRIIASPYWRTLETAEIVAERLGLPVTVEPTVRERAHFVCDIGSPRSRLSVRWPGFDFGELAERWWPDRETEGELLERCARFRAAIAESDGWQHILVVTHWGFIRGLTGRELANATIVSFDPTRP